MFKTVWSIELEQFAINLRDQGYSSSQIARQIYLTFQIGMSRNAVIGKFYRLGATPDQKRAWALARKDLDAQRPKRNGKHRVRPPRRIVKMYDPLPEPIVIPLEANWRGIPLLQLTNETCRFPSDHPYLFCGDPTADLARARPYCAFHTNIARQPHAAIRPTRIDEPTQDNPSGDNGNSHSLFRVPGPASDLVQRGGEAVCDVFNRNGPIVSDPNTAPDHPGGSVASVDGPAINADATG